MSDVEEKEKKERGINVFFDMESLRLPSGQLVPNLVVVQDEFGNEWIFEGLNATDDFCKSLFDRDEGELYKATLGAHSFARFFAHNGARFDFLPFVGKIFNYTNETPKIDFDGCSLLKISVFCCFWIPTVSYPCLWLLFPVLLAS